MYKHLFKFIIMSVDNCRCSTSTHFEAMEGGEVTFLKSTLRNVLAVVRGAISDCVRDSYTKYAKL